MSEENKIVAEEAMILIDDTMSQNIGEIALALSKAQGLMSGVDKNKVNPFFKSKYADLSAYIEMARESLAKNEIAVIQTTGNTDKAVIIKTMLAHSSGEWLRSELSMPLVKFDVQAVGSAITYGRRYALAAMLNIAQDDDDGEQATGAKAPVVKITKQQKDEFSAQVRTCLSSNDLPGLNELMEEWSNEEKIVLWGLFNSQERAAIKKLQKDG